MGAKKTYFGDTEDIFNPVGGGKSMLIERNADFFETNWH